MADETVAPTYKIEGAGGYVKIRYKVKVANGPVLKGAGEPEILDFVTGYRQVIPGLEKRLVGHTKGERLAFTVPADEAFGRRYEELVIEKSKADFHFPPGMEPYVGMELPLISGDTDAPDSVIIREVRDEIIVIDANHPLSGATLEYDLEVVEARPATSADVCAEWEMEEADSCGSCGCSPHQITLGGEEGEEK